MTETTEKRNLNELQSLAKDLQDRFEELRGFL
jgi:hypothetical protein